MGVDRFTADDADAESTLTEAPEFVILEQTWDLIQNEYVALDEVEQEELFYGAASGMVDALWAIPATPPSSIPRKLSPSIKLGRRVRRYRHPARLPDWPAGHRLPARWFAGQGSRPPIAGRDRCDGRRRNRRIDPGRSAGPLAR